MTTLEFTNKVLFQFLFIRLARCVSYGKTTAGGFIYPIVPFTGWRSNYIVLTKSGKIKSFIFKRYQ